MDMQVPDSSLLCCPHCGARPPESGGAANCQFCGGRVAPRQSCKLTILKALLWLVSAYRIWSLALFVWAIGHLLAVGGFASYFVAFLIIVPFTAALGISYVTRNAVSPWIVSFLLLVDLGVVIAPEHRILPMLNMFPMLPRTQSRILSWYFLVYGMLQFVILPPVAFSRSMWTAWRGGTPVLHVGICLFGFAVWGLIIFILIMAAIQAWG